MNRQKTSLNKTTIATVVILIIVGFFTYANYSHIKKSSTRASDHKNAEYIIDGNKIKLKDGTAETESAPGSASKIVTKYFGNELSKDLNSDGKEDVTFLITQTTGGTGTFYYVVSALNTEEGYIGSHATLLGDRIAPQTTESGPGKSIIVNYSGRNPPEGFTTPPSVGKSIRLILDIPTMQFGEVAQNFEGEADPTKMSLSMKQWGWVKTTIAEGKEVTPTKAGVFILTFLKDGTMTVGTDCNMMSARYKVTGTNTIVFSDFASTKMACENSQEQAFATKLRNVANYKFTSQGQLLLGNKAGSEIIILR